MPSRWQIALAGPADAAIPLAAPLAVVSAWLDDPLAGTQVRSPDQGSDRGANRGANRGSGHTDQARKWAFGPLRTVPGGHGLVTFQVRLLDDTLEDRLRAAVRPGSGVRLGAAAYRVTAPPEKTDEATWSQLRQWPAQRAWQVRFVTPTCVRRGSRTSPWPAPDSIGRGLAERWHRLHPATAPPLPGPGTSPVWVSDIEGRSEVHVVARRARQADGVRGGDEVVSGFSGRVRYVCDRGTDEQAAAFHALMSFAVYAGVGSHTTHGFGVLVHEPTWQPPTVRAGLR